MVAYLKVGLQVRTYSDYLKATQEVEKKIPWSCPGARGLKTTDNTPKPQATSFFPLKKLKGDQSTLKGPAMHLAHLDEEDTGSNEDKESNDPSRIEGVTKEFMVCLARAVKDAQMEEKHCYHCSSPEHFICNCLVIKTLRENTQLNGKEGTALERESGPLQQQSTHQRTPRQRFSRQKTTPIDSFLESRPLLALAWGQKHS